MRERASESRHVRASVLSLISFVSAASFAALARAVAENATAAIDEEVMDKVAPPPEHPTRRAAEQIAPFGKSWTYMPLAFVGAGAVLGSCMRGSDPRPHALAAAAVIATGAAAFVLNPAFDEWLPQPPAPPGRSSPDKPVFPSGHAFGPGAIMLTLSYALSREAGVNPVAAACGSLLLPILTAGGRIVEKKHWASDVVGGLLAAASVSAAVLAAYEGVRSTVAQRP